MPHPSSMVHWELRGAGLESLIQTEAPIKSPRPGELLVRIDACGVCFSDIKILNLGGNHPRLTGRDLAADPVVMGHETAMTVVAVGSDLHHRFAEGQRFLIQADVYYQGRGLAFGYALPGGYSQYQIIGNEILNGDEGCYLLPVGNHLSHAQAALCEPWACVEASYRYEPRLGPKPDGDTLLVLLEFDEVHDLIDEVRRINHIECITPNSHQWLRGAGGLAEGASALRERFPQGFDDILVYGHPTPQVASVLTQLLKPGGVFGLQDRSALPSVKVDVGSVHYRDHWYTGIPTGDVYAWGRTTELAPGGVTWVIGAGGPLGQMHVQRALSLPRPPRTILASQRGGPRLEELRRRFSALAQQRGVNLVFLDPLQPGFDPRVEVMKYTDDRGCDDVVVVVPDPRTVELAFSLLAPGGGLNLFAGLAVGTTAELELSRVATDGVRIWGTSGSKLSDLQKIKEKAEAGELITDRVVAAVGGIEAVRDGLEAVRDGVFPGKTMIYPHCRDLPLTPVPELAKQVPEIAAALTPAGEWTPAAEAALLARFGISACV